MALAGEERALGADDLEVAVLERGNGRCAFRRIEGDERSELTGVPAESTGPAPTDIPPPEPSEGEDESPAAED